MVTTHIENWDKSGNCVAVREKLQQANLLLPVAQDEENCPSLMAMIDDQENCTRKLVAVSGMCVMQLNLMPNVSVTGSRH